MKAYATTTESGRATWLGFGTDAIRVDTEVTGKKDPWRSIVESTRTAPLSELALMPKYNMLVNHIIRDGIDPQQTASYCSSPAYLKQVKVKGKTYRIFSGKIYTR